MAPARSTSTFLDVALANAGWVLTSASGINDHGWIIGQARNSITQKEQSFLLAVPVPKTGTWTMMLLVLGGLMLVARKRG